MKKLLLHQFEINLNASATSVRLILATRLAQTQCLLCYWVLILFTWFPITHPFNRRYWVSFLYGLYTQDKFKHRQYVEPFDLNFSITTSSLSLSLLPQIYLSSFSWIDTKNKMSEIFDFNFSFIFPHIPTGFIQFQLKERRLPSLSRMLALGMLMNIDRNGNRKKYYSTTNLIHKKEFIFFP